MIPRKVLILLPSSLEVIDDGTKLRAYATVQALGQCFELEILHFEGRFSPPASAFTRLRRLLSPTPSLLRRFCSPTFGRIVAERAVLADLCYCVSLQMGLFKRYLPREMPCVVDNYNVESEILATLARQRPWTTRWFWHLETLKLRWAEARILRAADACVAISEEDASSLVRMAPSKRIFTIPPALDLTPYAELVSAVQPATMVFIGALDWHVNEDAARWFAMEVFPLIQGQHPQARLWLVGRNPGPGVCALAGPSVEVHGNVESVLPFLSQAQVGLAPLRYGSGVQYKVIQGMAAGKPMVLTPTSATGLQARPDEHFLLGTDAKTYAAACCRLIAEPSYGKEMGLRARQFALRHHSEEQLAERLKEVVLNTAGAR